MNEITVTNAFYVKLTTDKSYVGGAPLNCQRLVFKVDGCDPNTKTRYLYIEYSIYGVSGQPGPTTAVVTNLKTVWAVHDVRILMHGGPYDGETCIGFLIDRQHHLEDWVDNDGNPINKHSRKPGKKYMKNGHAVIGARLSDGLAEYLTSKESHESI